MIERIEDVNDKRLRFYSKFTDAQLMNYPEGSPGMFIAESRLVIERAMAAGARPVSIFVEDRWFEPSRDLVDAIEAIDPATPVLQVTHAQMQEITGYRVTRGPLAVFMRPELPGLDELLRDAHRVAVLEGITNFTNIGAIFRSAAALGMDAVLITPGCHDPLYKRASRVSVGTVFQVPWGRVESVEELRARGFTAAALALEPNAITLDDPVLKRIDKLALVLGSEGYGLDRATIDACDMSVIIPMEHEVDSLNVAAASAVAFWELRYGKGR